MEAYRDGFTIAPDGIVPDRDGELGHVRFLNGLVLRKGEVYGDSSEDDMEEAAFMDGASNFTIFARIYLPLSKPALATVGLFYAVNRWNGYFWAMNLITSDNKLPLQVLLKKLIVDRVANETEAAIVTSASTWSPTTVIYAIIIIAIVPMLVAYPFVQNYFKTGLTIGANKG